MQFEDHALLFIKWGSLLTILISFMGSVGGLLLIGYAPFFGATRIEVNLAHLVPLFLGFYVYNRCLPQYSKDPRTTSAHVIILGVAIIIFGNWAGSLLLLAGGLYYLPTQNDKADERPK